MKKYKILILALSFLMIIGVFTGCSSDDPLVDKVEEERSYLNGEINTSTDLQNALSEGIEDINLTSNTEGNYTATSEVTLDGNDNEISGTFTVKTGDDSANFKKITIEKVDVQDGDTSFENTAVIDVEVNSEGTQIAFDENSSAESIKANKDFTLSVTDESGEETEEEINEGDEIEVKEGGDYSKPTEEVADSDNLEKALKDDSVSSIILTDNITLDSGDSHKIDRDLTIDLSGYTLTQNDDIEVTEGNTLTITSEEDGAKLEGNGDITGDVVNDAVPTFNNVTSDSEVYSNRELITVTADIGESGLTITGDFSNIDDEFTSGAETVTDNGDGTYTIEYAISPLNTTTPDGTYTIPVTAEDRAGNSNTDKSLSVELDNTKPNPPTNVDVTLTPDASVEISWGKGSDKNFDHEEVLYKLENSEHIKIVDESATSPVTYDGNDGDNIKFRVFTEDEVDNQASTEWTDFKTLDGTAPTASLDSITSSVSGSQTFSGDATDDKSLASWSLKAKNHVSATDVTIATGNSSVNGADFVTDYDTTNLADGDWDVVLTVTDTAGNESTDSIPVTVDNTSPTFNSVTADSSVYRNGDTITITADIGEAGLTVTGDFSYLDDQFISGAETVTDNGDGTYIITHNIGLSNNISDGIYKIPVTAEDRVGNKTKYNSLSVELDNTRPSVNISYYSPINADNSNSYTISGSTEADATIDVTLDDTNSVVNGSTVAAGDGSFSLTLDASSLVDGTVEISVTATDVAGNTSTTENTSVTKDTVKPEGIITDPSTNSTDRLEITFNEKLDIGTTNITKVSDLVEGSIVLVNGGSKNGGTDVTVKVVDWQNVDTSSPVLTLFFDSNYTFKSGDKIDVNFVTDSVEDLAGNSTAYANQHTVQ